MDVLRDPATCTASRNISNSNYTTPIIDLTPSRSQTSQTRFSHKARERIELRSVGITQTPSHV